MTTEIIKSEKEQSRMDDTLLTVDFNLRTINDVHSSKVPQGRYFINRKTFAQ